MEINFKKAFTTYLTKKQKYILRNWINLRFLSPPLSKRLIIILGCQRSGTTLTLLMLQAHPQVQGYDEFYADSPFPFPHSVRLLYHNIRKTFICLKLPAHVFHLNYFVKYFNQSKIVWPVRHPYSVISSMRSLKNSEGSWIDRCAKREIQKMIDLFPELELVDINTLDGIELGAYVWKYKNMAINQFKNKGLNVFDFKYEELLDNPRQTLSHILTFIELDWSEEVLMFHQSQSASKKYAGNTRGDQPLNPSRKAPSWNLSEEEKCKINSICCDLMKKYHY